MKTPAPRTWPWLIAVCLSAALFVSVTHWLFASPSEEITQAVAADGTNVQKANADQFVDAFSSVLVSADEKHSSSYIEAAVKLRPDLKDRIVAAAKDVVDVPGGDASDNQASGHQRRCKVCCGDHDEDDTITLPCNKVPNYLAHHPDCRRGACHGH
jgi:hypothetical protein